MQTLYETVKEILDTGRIGVPVFVRCAAQITPENGYAEGVLARMLTMICSWLEASPLRIYAQSRDDSTQIAVTIQYVNGKTAIVSVDIASGVDASQLRELGLKIDLKT